MVSLSQLLIEECETPALNRIKFLFDVCLTLTENLLGAKQILLTRTQELLLFDFIGCKTG